ncbi:hypothetical protein AGMMS49960_15910 [Betaproteobacteria bacterium]|nr:hypothetical protein AGMMS49543_25320 [Betaproteobacteria bacterium]GHU02802.1 hypothetical protein AGMMS49960_15910 [Betaproteobacteria bacterium]
MKHTLSRIAATGVWALVICAACVAPRYSDTPYPQRFEANAQPWLQAVGHWRIIAEHFAEQIDSDLTLQDIDAALYIPPELDDFVFVEGFRELLATALSRLGRKIHLAPHDAPQGALTVDIRYSVYKFNPERKQKHAEILLTSTVSNGENIASRISNVYYVTDGEALYWKRLFHNYGQSKELDVKGGD